MGKRIWPYQKMSEAENTSLKVTSIRIQQQLVLSNLKLIISTLDLEEEIMATKAEVVIEALVHEI